MVKRELIIVTRILDDHGGLAGVLGFHSGSGCKQQAGSQGQGRIVILHDHAGSTSAVATTRKQFTIYSSLYSLSLTHIFVQE